MFWIFEIWITLLVITEPILTVEVHFENKDGGFFLRHTPKQHFQTIPDLSSVLPSTTTPSSILSVDRFTVFQSSQPISIRATYGPFSTKQTVPARYIVPDPLDSLPIPEHNSTATTVDLQELVTHHLDMSAHIVRNEIPRDSPVLRVLFHTGSDPGSRRQMMIQRHQRVCIVLHANLQNERRTPLSAACSPEGEDGVCLAQITLPSSWWPPLPPPDKTGRPGKPVKTPPRLVQISYSVLEPRPLEGEGCVPRIQIQPVTVLGMVPLVPAKAAYKELRLAEIITMLVPHPPLFPLARMHVPVFMERDRSKDLTAIVIRARVKSGVRILSATPSTDRWNITVEINPKHTGASVTALRREPQEPDQEAAAQIGEVSELFTWLLELTEDAAEIYDGARIVWSTRFEPHAPEPLRSEAGHRTHAPADRKPSTRLEVQKDDIQAVVPISKNWEVMNTAVLTGRQVSQAMKVFIVSQAGKAADVTLQSSCHSEDESVLKVSSSCSSVYVDGSEARGSVNGSVLVKYGTYIGLARFTVWMPEFPLDLSVPDVRLSQIKSWKVPDYHGAIGKSRRKRSYGWGVGQLQEEFGNGVGSDRPPCRIRFQQSPVDVYAHFMATDHDSGRITYFISRRTYLRVTDLVLPLLRVSDPKIASLRGRILQGRYNGRAEVQVISPITGRVIGAKEVRVSNDKVVLNEVKVRVVSGLQLNISPDSGVENGYVAETSVTRRLTAQYQEGLLDIELEFSDGQKTPLRDIADSDYHLIVKSLDNEVVAFAPMVASHHPRVIAVGEGRGDLLQVQLQLNEDCRIATRGKVSGKAAAPLASAAAAVEVDFSVSDVPHRPDFVQNDGGIPMKDENNHEPTVQARQHHSLQNGLLNNHNRGVTRYHQPQNNLTPLEIGMYVLLAAFCFAIVVFVVSCVVYASKFKPQGMDAQLGSTTTAAAVPTSGRSTVGMGTSLAIMREPRKPRESTTNAHDWVWLGRATLERGSGQLISNRNSTINNNNSTEMRITANPMSLNYSEPDDCIVQATSFDNPNHIELPSRHIDTSTYSKRDRNINNNVQQSFRNNNKDTEWNNDNPPPLPPHATPLPPHSTPLPPHVTPVPQSHPSPSNEDYKPPVPPHRNIGVTARMSTSNPASSPVAPPPRKHHHHHHHRNSKPQPIENSHPAASPIRNLNQPIDSRINDPIDKFVQPRGGVNDSFSPIRNLSQANDTFSPIRNLNQTIGGLNDSNQPIKPFMESRGGLSDTFSPIRNLGQPIEVKEKTPFEFEDAEPSGEKEEIFQLKGEDRRYKDDDNVEFVQFPKNEGTNGISRGMHGEVKRATIIGNPMFSAKMCEESAGQIAGQTPEALTALDDLQLDMDYEQIMHYFDNLKESNA